MTVIIIFSPYIWY